MARQLGHLIRQRAGQFGTAAHAADHFGLLQRGADRGHVAWPAPIQRKARQRAIKVGHLAQGAAQVGAKGILGHQSLDGVQSRVDRAQRPGR